MLASFLPHGFGTETVPNVQEEVPETARDCYINVFRAKVVPERLSLIHI